MSDWNRAFRRDFTESSPLAEADAARVSECVLTEHPVFRTWRNVHLGDECIGMVRVRLGGVSECRRVTDEDPIYCGDAAKLNSQDDPYSLAILVLRELVDEDKVRAQERKKRAVRSNEEAVV